MNVIARANSENSKTVKNTIKLFSFRKSKLNKETASTNTQRKHTLNKYIVPQIHVSMDTSASGSNTSPNIRSSEIVLGGRNETQWSHESPEFYSLPNRGSKKIKNPKTKALINLDTFFQSKTLLYTDHQRSPINGSNHHFEKLNLIGSQYNSVDSLNSFNDPDIVAALDQIASTMGLIDDKVSRTSFDPINYLLKTRSFSERISIRRTSPRNHVNETESNGLKIKNKMTVMESRPLTSRTSKDNFKSPIPRVSQASLRRTKSYTPTKVEFSSSKISEVSKIKIENNKLKMVDNVTKNDYNTELKELTNPYQKNDIPKQEFEMYKKEDICDLTQSFLRSHPTQSHTSYINISISAFGYKPFQIVNGISKMEPKPIETESMKINQSKNSHNSFDDFAFKNNEIKDSVVSSL